MYENWAPSLECPTLLQQVIKDLWKTMDVPGETIDRLTGKDTEEKIGQILLAYTAFVRQDYQNEIVEIASQAIGDHIGEVVKPFIRKMMPSPVPYRGVPQGGY